jgi:hypothetical protein
MLFLTRSIAKIYVDPQYLFEPSNAELLCRFTAAMAKQKNSYPADRVPDLRGERWRKYGA